MKNTSNRSKLPIRISLIAILIIVVSVGLRSIVLSKSPNVFLPNQEKELSVEFPTDTLDPRLYVYIDKNHFEAVEVELVYEDGVVGEPLFVGEDSYTPKGKIVYSYAGNSGEKAKNKTDQKIDLELSVTN